VDTGVTTPRALVRGWGNRQGRPLMIGDEQEHAAADLPAQRLAGAQARHRNAPKVQALPSVSTRLDERWATDLCRAWGGRDGWLSLALVIDCHTRQLLGWHLSRSGKASTAAAAREQALITRFGILGRVPAPFLLRSDNGFRAMRLQRRSI
jgi:transposase InsO family protein